MDLSKWRVVPCRITNHQWLACPPEGTPGHVYNCLLEAAPTTDAPTLIDPAELAALRRDAARYRFIRSGECHVHAIWFQSFGERFNLMESDLDDSVDAALAANGGKP